MRGSDLRGQAFGLASPIMPSITAEWSEIADAILANATKEELLEIAKVAGRVQLQALVQFSQRPLIDPSDCDLLSPEEIVAESRGAVSLWSVREAMRRGQLPKRPPCPGATRGFKVPRSAVRAWLTKAL